MSIIPYNHFKIYHNYYKYNKFENIAFKGMLSFFCYKYIYDKNSSNKIG